MKSDSRIFKSKTALKKALVILLANQPFNEITVQDICHTANVTRVTFYAHYHDKESLMHDFIEDSLNDIFSFGKELNSLSFKEQISYIVTMIFSNTIDKIAQYKSIEKIFDCQGDSLIVHMLQLTAMNKIVKNLDAFLIKSNEEFAYPSSLIASYLIGGVTEMIHYYIVNHDKISVDELRKYGALIINRSLKALLS